RIGRGQVPGRLRLGGDASAERKAGGDEGNGLLHGQISLQKGLAGQWVTRPFGTPVRFVDVCKPGDCRCYVGDLRRKRAVSREITKMVTMAAEALAHGLMGGRRRQGARSANRPRAVPI